MSKTVGAFLTARLCEWGVKRIYGYPGDGINGILSGLEKEKERLRFIQTRHEEAAALMACGHAKYTGEVGVCLATSGPGAIHLLNGLYDAKLDHQPVVAIMGQKSRMGLGGNVQQEVDLLSLFKDVASDYLQMCTDPRQVRHVIDRAFRIAISQRTVTAIIIPNDVQQLPYEEPTHEHGSVHSAIGYRKPTVVPMHTELQKAADLLNTGKKVAILIGAGAYGAAGEITEVARLLGAGVAKALLGKSVLPDDLPYVTGSIGLLGTVPSWELMSECDTLLMIGSSFPYSEFLPKEGQARGVQIDLDARMLGIRYPMEVQLQGDTRETLRALLPLIQNKQDRSWRHKIETSVSAWWQVLEARSMNEANPINPQKVFWELSKFLPGNCILAGDSGSTAFWFARDLKIKDGMLASISGSLATMCSSVPYAIAAKFAYPERMPVAICGDGAMQMLCMNELITISKYWKTWQTPQFMVLVVNNGDLNMVTWEQRGLTGDPKFEDSQNIPDVNYAEFARMLGLEGIRIDKPEDVTEGLAKAMQLEKPVLVDVICDPNVPILPPHTTTDQKKKFFSAMMKGEPERNEILKQIYEEVKDGLRYG
jgi:pyruvate dehydrogenase (quinone)